MIIYNKSKGFWQGIPARDLTDEEWQSIDKDTQKTLLDIGLYEVKSGKLKKDEPIKDGE